MGSWEVLTPASSPLSLIPPLGHTNRNTAWGCPKPVLRVGWTDGDTIPNRNGIQASETQSMFHTPGAPQLLHGDSRRDSNLFLASLETCIMGLLMLGPLCFFFSNLEPQILPASSWRLQWAPIQMLWPWLPVLWTYWVLIGILGCGPWPVTFNMCFIYVSTFYCIILAEKEGKICVSLLKIHS